MLAFFAASLTMAANGLDSAKEPLLMRHPTVSKTSIVFEFAGDLWKVPRSGGNADRLTVSPGIDSNPTFSPDGSKIAFTADYDGTSSVYVIPANGGEPKRLTYNPGGNQVIGWTPDGKSVVFASTLLSNTDPPRMFTVDLYGHMPVELPFPSGTMASFSPGGKRIAYVPEMHWEAAWKRYRGGQMYTLRIGALSDSKCIDIPNHDSNDFDPLWIGKTIYFLSDPTGPVGIFAYDLNSGQQRAVVAGMGFDIKSETAGPGCIAYEKLGSIHLLDLKTGDHHPVHVVIRGDFPHSRTEMKVVPPIIHAATIAPNAKRVVFQDRGHLISVPAQKGDTRDLDSRQGIARRYPSWSPNGKWLAYFIDDSGNYRLAIRNMVTGNTEEVEPGDAPAYYYSPVWSPNSKMIAYTDQRHRLWVVDGTTRKNTLVDEGLHDLSFNPVSTALASSIGRPSWSPDSKWIAYNRDLPNYLSAIFLYNVATGKKTQVTDGMSDCVEPVFDRDGSYLYFLCSTTIGITAGGIDISSLENMNPTYSVYVAPLRKDVPDPLAPQSDEGGPAAMPAGPGAGARPPVGALKAKASKPAPKPKGSNIDLKGLEARAQALPIPEGKYSALIAGPAGSLFIQQVPAVEGNLTSDVGIPSVLKFTLGTRSLTPFLLGGIIGDSTPDGTLLLVQRLLPPAGLAIVSAMAPPAPGQGQLNLSDFQVTIDPRAEWRQMFHEALRIERDFFYDPHFHGQNLDALGKRYEPFLAGLRSRNDLNYLFEDMLGEICVGHMFIAGGDIRQGPAVADGLLGADYDFANDRYQFKRIYTGEEWNPGLVGPLARPGVDAKAGEYLLAIGGVPLKATDNIYERLQGTAGKQVEIEIGPTPDGKDSRKVTVVPVANEFPLRNVAWVEDRRKMVDKLSGGLLAYVHVPDTSIGGWLSFNRYYFAQVDKKGAIIDERYNHGGFINDYMIEEMKQTLQGMFTPRWGVDTPTPTMAIFGPKVMVINQYAGSGGDMFPWLFRHEKVGPLVGHRTWGGLVGIGGYPTLIDGGTVTAPRDAFYNPNGTWDVENHGVAPDYRVTLDPYLWRKGEDPQLEKAVQVALQLLKDHPQPPIKKPLYPDKSKLPFKNSG